MKTFSEFEFDGVIDVGDKKLTIEEFEELFLKWLKEKVFYYGGSIKGFEDDKQS